jgi:hypothetical protein
MRAVLSARSRKVPRRQKSKMSLRSIVPCSAPRTRADCWRIVASTSGRSRSRTGPRQRLLEDHVGVVDRLPDLAGQRRAHQPRVLARRGDGRQHRGGVGPCRAAGSRWPCRPRPRHGVRHSPATAAPSAARSPIRRRRRRAGSARCGTPPRSGARCSRSARGSGTSRTARLRSCPACRYSSSTQVSLVPPPARSSPPATPSSAPPASARPA